MQKQGMRLRMQTSMTKTFSLRAPLGAMPGGTSISFVYRWAQGALRCQARGRGRTVAVATATDYGKNTRERVGPTHPLRTRSVSSRAEPSFGPLLFFQTFARADLLGGSNPQTPTAAQRGGSGSMLGIDPWALLPLNDLLH